MKRLALIIVLCTTTLATPAASAHRNFRNQLRLLQSSQVCPPDVPVQRISVMNTSTTTPLNLARVELAVHDQSLQLREAWGTPCIEFGSNGNWTLKLTNSQSTSSPDGSVSYPLGGHHSWDGVNARAYVEHPPSWTYNRWSRAFSHEVLEMTADPTVGRYLKNTQGYSVQIEVCDPVEQSNYRLDGVELNDFALPSYFTGDAGPYDHLNLMSQPFTY